MTYEVNRALEAVQRIINAPAGSTPREIYEDAFIAWHNLMLLRAQMEQPVDDHVQPSLFEVA